MENSRKYPILDKFFENTEWKQSVDKHIDWVYILKSINPLSKCEKETIDYLKAKMLK